MTPPPLFAVIMAGGSGTRFWPASRAARPKQFLPIAGELPMIVETRRRLGDLIPDERVLVVTTASQVPLVRAALPELPEENILAEPEARNTAPCLAFAAAEVARRDPDAVQAVLAADHVIAPVEAFRESLSTAHQIAASGDSLLTFGVRPTFPATGYGYIDASDRAGDGSYHVNRFVEKPELERAKEFLAAGSFFWNSGMFVWHTRAILEAMREHAPALHRGAEQLQRGEDLAKVYAEMPADPIDVAVMERAKNVRMLPIEYSWNDVGSWSALPDLSAPDTDGNWATMTDGAVLVSEDASGNVTYAEGDRVIALVGVQDLVVVQTDNATLVCPRDRAQDVKRIVDQLKAKHPKHL